MRFYLSKEEKIKLAKRDFTICFHLFVIIALLTTLEKVLETVLRTEFPDLYTLHELKYLQIGSYSLLLLMASLSLMFFYKVYRLIKSQSLPSFVISDKKNKKLLYSLTPVLAAFIVFGLTYPLIPSITTYDIDTRYKLDKEINKINSHVNYLIKSGKFVELEAKYINQSPERGDMKFNLVFNDFIISKIAREKRGDVITHNVDSYSRSKSPSGYPSIFSHYAIKSEDKKFNEVNWSGIVGSSHKGCLNIYAQSLSSNNATLVSGIEYICLDGENSPYKKPIAIDFKLDTITDTSNIRIVVEDISSLNEIQDFALLNSQFKFSDSTLDESSERQSISYCIEGYHKADPEAYVNLNSVHTSNLSLSTTDGSCSR